MRTHWGCYSLWVLEKGITRQHLPVGFYYKTGGPIWTKFCAWQLHSWVQHLCNCENDLYVWFFPIYTYSKCCCGLSMHTHRGHNYVKVPEVLIGSMPKLHISFPSNCNWSTHNLVYIGPPLVKLELKRRLVVVVLVVVVVYFKLCFNYKISIQYIQW